MAVAAAVVVVTVDWSEWEGQQTVAAAVEVGWETFLRSRLGRGNLPGDSISNTPLHGRSPAWSCELDTPPMAPLTRMELCLRHPPHGAAHPHGAVPQTPDDEDQGGRAALGPFQTHGQAGDGL
jgi:hypothetical protein